MAARTLNGPVAVIHQLLISGAPWARFSARPHTAGRHCQPGSNTSPEMCALIDTQQCCLTERAGGGGRGPTCRSTRAGPLTPPRGGSFPREAFTSPTAADSHSSASASARCAAGSVALRRSARAGVSLGAAQHARERAHVGYSELEAVAGVCCVGVHPTAFVRAGAPARLPGAERSAAVEVTCCRQRA